MTQREVRVDLVPQVNGSLMKAEELIKKLSGAGFRILSDKSDMVFVPTGSYALNKIMSGKYTGGVPVGQITQFFGEHSTAKTVFGTCVLAQAQKKGYHTILIDSETTYNKDFAVSLGIDPDRLLVVEPNTVEDCFKAIEDVVTAIREDDKDTPIVVLYDSIAVSPSKAEYEAEGFEGNNMQGAIRAKSIGSGLRKLNTFVYKQNVALLIINQIRHKVNVRYGSPKTLAAGGKALEYYLAINLECSFSKSDYVKDEADISIGIKGSIKATKNKITRPDRDCEFKLLFDEGLVEDYGLLKCLVEDGLLEKKGSWYSCDGRKFQNLKDFNKYLKDTSLPAFDSIREVLGL
jgi:recombination protein RecA